MTAASLLYIDPEEDIFIAPSIIHGLGLHTRPPVVPGSIYDFLVQHLTILDHDPEYLEVVEHIICPFHQNCSAILTHDIACAANHSPNPNSILAFFGTAENPSFGFEVTRPIPALGEITIDYGLGYTPALIGPIVILFP
jgi:hypothetical protein